MVEKIPPNLVKITAAHIKGRELTVSVSRLKIYRTDPNLEHRGIPKDRVLEEDDDSEAEDIQPLKDQERDTIVIPIQTGAPATAMVDVADAMKDTGAGDMPPAAPMHMDVQYAVSKSADNEDDVSMEAGPPTIRVPHPITNLLNKSSVQIQRREKRKWLVLSPNLPGDGSASEPEKALQKRSR